MGRRERDKNGKMTHRSLFFCHYRNVVNYKHRKAITQIVLSCHSLAIEKLRWRRPLIPRAERLCRFCKLKVETPEHALLECESNIDLVNVRSSFEADIEGMTRDLSNVHQLGLTQYLKKLIASQDTIERVSQLAHDVLGVYDSFPVYIPAIVTL